MELDECTCEPNPCYDLTGYKKAKANKANGQTSYVSIQQGRAKSGNKKWIAILIAILIVHILILVAVAIAAGFISRITTLDDRIGQLESSMSRTKVQLSTLESSVNTWSNSSVDHYQGCIQEIKNCTVSGSGNTYYVRSCRTQPTLQLDPTVSSVVISMYSGTSNKGCSKYVKKPSQ